MEIAVMAHLCYKRRCPPQRHGKVTDRQRVRQYPREKHDVSADIALIRLCDHCEQLRGTQVDRPKNLEGVAFYTVYRIGTELSFR